MTRYRDRLPQLGDAPFLTDGGIETTLIFHEGLDLPYFTAFHLLRAEACSVRTYEPRSLARGPITARDDNSGTRGTRHVPGCNSRGRERRRPTRARAPAVAIG